MGPVGGLFSVIRSLPERLLELVEALLSSPSTVDLVVTRRAQAPFTVGVKEVVSPPRLRLRRRKATRGHGHSAWMF